jgi:hypothetical protein
MISEMLDDLSIPKRLVKIEDVFAPSRNLEVDHD